MRRALLLFALGLLIAGAAASANAADEEQRMTGAVASIDTTARILAVTEDVEGGGDIVRFQVASDAVIRFHGLKGKLEQLKPGDIVTVTWVARDRAKVATAVQHM